MKISFCNTTVIHFARFQYVIDYLDHHPLKPKDWHLTVNAPGPCRRIVYGPASESDSDWVIPSVEGLLTGNTPNLETIQSCSYTHKDQHLFSVEPKYSHDCPFFTGNHFQFDILETIFFHISRYEEQVAAEPNLNTSRWLAEEQHFLVRNKLEKNPVVDQLVGAFFEVVTNQSVQKPTRFEMTHDLDVIYRFRPAYKFFRSVIAHFYYQRPWKQLKRDVSHFLGMIFRRKKDPYDCFDLLLTTLPQYVRRIFFVMTGGRSPYDNFYHYRSRALRKILDVATENGYVIGLHPSYHAGLEIDLFREEQKRLESIISEPVTTSRQHWLRFDWKITPEILEKTGIKEDRSLGYNGRIGFRCGTGFPFRPYFFKEERALLWTEYPLVLMESAVIHESRRTRKGISEIVSTFLEANRWDTYISLNFHNSNFDATLDTGREISQVFEAYFNPPTGQTKGETRQ